MEPGYLYAIGAAVTWGLMYAIDGKILEKFSPMNLLFIQCFLLAIVTLPFFILGNGWADLTKNRAVWPLIALTILLAVIANFWILKSIQLLGATTASSFEISYPFFVAIFSMLLFGARLSLPVVMGGMLIFLGSIVIIRYG